MSMGDGGAVGVNGDGAETAASAGAFLPPAPDALPPAAANSRGKPQLPHYKICTGNCRPRRPHRKVCWLPAGPSHLLHEAEAGQPLPWR